MPSDRLSLAKIQINICNMLIFMPMLFTGIAFAESNINSAKFLLNYYIFPNRSSGAQPLTYYDLIMGGKYHLYFTFNKDISPADYKKWTADRIENELLPLLDEHACDDTLTTKQGSSIKWPEFRRNGGGLVIHMQDMDNFSVNVEAPADSIKCPL